MSELALGSLTFGREADEATSRAIVSTYLDAGGNFIDTADAYGRSEEVLGPLLVGIRDEVLLASKVGLPIAPGINGEGTSRLRILRQVERTLRRLGTDWLDVYYVHAWDPVTPLDETLSTLDRLVAAGTVRYLGVSNYFGWQIATALGRADLRGWERIALVTAEYSLVERGLEREIQSLCAAAGLALMPWSPLGGGLLSGKYRGHDQPAAGTRAAARTNSTATVRRRLAEQRSASIADAVGVIAASTGRSPAQVALNWVMHRPAVTAPVIGVRTVEQLRDNLGEAGGQLDPADRDRLDQASLIELGYPAEWNARFGIRSGARPDREVEPIGPPSPS